MCSSDVCEVRLRCVYGLHKWSVCARFSIAHSLSHTHKHTYTHTHTHTHTHTLTHTHGFAGVLVFFTCWPNNLISARVWGHSVNAVHAYSSCLHPCTQFAVVKVTSPLLIHCDKVTLSLAAFICLALHIFFLLVYKDCIFSEWENFVNSVEIGN